MSEQWLAALRLLPEYLGQHVLFERSGARYCDDREPAAGAACRLPAVIRTMVLGLARLVQTIPGLALIALFYPFFWRYRA